MKRGAWRPGVSPWVLAAVALVPAGARPGSTQETAPPRLVADTIDPAAFQPGERSTRRVTFRVPEGWTVRWPRTLPPGGDAEALGGPEVRRAPTTDGTVVWKLAYPFTAWTAGTRVLPPMAIDVRGPAAAVRLRLGGGTFRVDDALPEGAATLRAAPPRGALPGHTVPWRLLAAVPVALVLVTGGGWWRASAGPAAPPPDAGLRPPPDARAAFSAALTEVEASPGTALVSLARSARSHPAVVAAGGRDCHTTAELVRVVETPEGSGFATVLGGLLTAADGVRYGGLAVKSDEVRGLAVAILERWDA